MAPGDGHGNSAPLARIISRAAFREGSSSGEAAVTAFDYSDVNGVRERSLLAANRRWSPRNSSHGWAWNESARRDSSIGSRL